MPLFFDNFLSAFIFFISGLHCTCLHYIVMNLSNFHPLVFEIFQVNGVDFTQVQHSRAVDVLRKSNQSVAMLLERFH